MPEVIPDHVPSPRTLLAWDGAAYRPVAIDALGHLNVNVLTNVGLDDALQSVDTDRLIVRGEDQLFSIDAVVANTTPTNLAAGHMWADSAVVPAGCYWVLTNVLALNGTTATTLHDYVLYHDLVLTNFDSKVAAFGVGVWSVWAGHLYMDAGDSLRIYFVGGLAGDVCQVAITGYQMTLET